MSGLQIRQARPSDRAAIEAVTLAAYQEYAAVMPAHWEGYRQNILATLADVQPAAQIVADQDGHYRRDSLALSGGKRDRQSGERTGHAD